MLSSVAARGGQSAARAAQRVSVLVASPPLASSARRAATPSTAGARRSMGGHARNIGLPGEHVPIEVGKLHKTLGTVYMTTMFLWMMYRAKEDGLVLLGLEHPWDHMHEHGHDDDEGVTFNFVPPADEDEDEDDEDEDDDE